MCLHVFFVAIRSDNHPMLLRLDPQSGGHPAKHPTRVWPTLGAAQQADTGAAGGAEGGEVPGGAPRGDQ